MPPADIQALGIVVDVNSASAAELATLPGVGPAIAGRIVAERPFARVRELLRVRGIGPVRLQRLSSRVRTETPSRASR
ncbi:MAG: helix-hairpin-helix domain-containing protein [Myxococcales bacterium FL481]|nr:MAG: helix-hairpin-helix domain-containing protein [Myxococcales bacterium FL481]